MAWPGILLAWFLTDVLVTYGTWHRRRIFSRPPAAAVEPPPGTHEPRAAVVVAIKGVSEITPLFLEALCRQQHPNFRLIFALESDTDAALARLRALQAQRAGGREITIIVAGVSTRRAQKVHNLLAALATLRPDDRIVVFADADIVPGATWLLELVRPVVASEATVSCGYRWLLPVNARIPALIVAAADNAVATAARSRFWNLCWGGSLALDRAVLDRLDLPRLWDSVASDDLTLTRALRSRGLYLYPPPHALVPTPISSGWSDTLRFMRRQYLLVRIYAPRHWLAAAWNLWVPTIGAVSATRLILWGHSWALGFVLASIALMQIRLSIRSAIARRVLSAAEWPHARRTILFARFAWPLIHLVHLAAFASSAFGRRFSWAGIRYRLIGDRVEVEGA
jgi:cellulose synthase/poly-beta-1,6-N-acetylglucosamine synthase-like glycosyltransferase